MLILVFIYIAISVIVSLSTILEWKVQENIEMNTPVGDLEYFEFDYGYRLSNIIFAPSIIICTIYKFLRAF